VEGRRDNQRYRTRKDLVQAAARLMKEGRSPSVADVADAARISRATAYRYFPNREALLAEAPLDGALPNPATLFSGEASTDPVARVDRAEAALHEAIQADAIAYRVMLARLLEQHGRSGRHDAVPRRQNRRTALIDAALAPARSRFDDDVYAKLRAALALFFGTESMVVFTDVLRLDPAAARAVKSWGIAALVEAALAQSARTFRGRRARPRTTRRRA
jgi:AcrR family transcriptional regulator